MKNNIELEKNIKYIRMNQQFSKNEMEKLK